MLQSSTNIGLGWKCILVKNGLAYREKAHILAKEFLRSGPGQVCLGRAENRSTQNFVFPAKIIFFNLPIFDLI
jgi:hypothetical protein